MYGVRTSRGFRGLGDVLDPTAGTALDCGFFAGGVFKPECWALTLGPGIVGKDNYQAALGVAYPDRYPAPPAPALPAAPSGTAVPGSQADIMLPGTLATEAAQQTQQQNQEFFSNLAQSLDQGGGSGGGLETGALIALGLAAGLGVLLVTSMGGRRRR